MSTLEKAKIDHHGMVGEMVVRAAEAKAANHIIKALITLLVEGKGKSLLLTRKRVDPQDLTLPYLFIVRGKHSNQFERVYGTTRICCWS